MDKVKRVLRRVFYLPVGWSFAVAAAGFLLLAYALSHDTPAVLDHLAYHLSAYGLVVLVTALTRVYGAAREKLHKSKAYIWLQTSPLGILLRQDPDFRAGALLFLSICWNVICALVKLVSGIVLRSEWLLYLGGYYLLLAGLRLLVARPTIRGADAAEGWRRYRTCGATLLVMNIVLGGMVARLLTRRGTFHYPGPLVYLMAAYAFGALISAGVKLAVTHRRADPLRSAARAISMTAAMVSMLALETALIERFGDDIFFQRVMVAVTGGAVCLIELWMALYMIHRGGEREQATENRERATGNREQE